MLLGISCESYWLISVDMQLLLLTVPNFVSFRQAEVIPDLLRDDILVLSELLIYSQYLVWGKQLDSRILINFKPLQLLWSLAGKYRLLQTFLVFSLKSLGLHYRVLLATVEARVVCSVVRFRMGPIYLANPTFCQLLS